MFMPTQTVFFKKPPTYLRLYWTVVTIALEKPWKFSKNETQKFYSGGFCPEGFCLGGFCPGIFVGGAFVLEPLLAAGHVRFPNHTLL